MAYNRGYNPDALPAYVEAFSYDLIPWHLHVCRYFVSSRGQSKLTRCAYSHAEPEQAAAMLQGQKPGMAPLPPRQHSASSSSNYNKPVPPPPQQQQQNLRPQDGYGRPPPPGQGYSQAGPGAYGAGPPPPQQGYNDYGRAQSPRYD
ncbi:hypothetical protein LTR33_019301, partial [Friedmanniomyces endolithicus]